MSLFFGGVICCAIFISKGSPEIKEGSSIDILKLTIDHQRWNKKFAE
jgi:hypothetical protein